MRMKFKNICGALAFAAALSLNGCGGDNATPNANSNSTAANANDTATNPKEAQPNAPLPDAAFKAQLTLSAPPAKLRAGQKETVKVKVKNLSDVRWRVRGEGADNMFYVAVGNAWRDSDGVLLTNMDGRYGLPENLEPGAEVEVPLQITAPKEAGEYILELDLVQEGVTWFKDKGSETSKTKIRVEK